MRAWLLFLSMLGQLALTGRAYDTAGVSTLTLAPGVDPAAYQVTCFARDLPFPYGMALLGDGSLLVGLSRPTLTNDGVFHSVGELRRFVDLNKDGVADDVGIPLATNLPGVLVDVRTTANLVFAVSAEFGNEQILCFRQDPEPSAPLHPLGHIRLGYPWVYHQTYGLALRTHPETPGDIDLIFNVGSLENAKHATNLITLSGLASGELSVETVYQITLHDRGDHLDSSPPVLLATGLRNAAAIGFHPPTGDLYLGDNGIDDPPNGGFSVDELNVIRQADLGVRVIDFGFPSTFIRSADQVMVGTEGVAPQVPFFAAAAGENEGITQLTPAPSRFPAGWNQGFFVGFHGVYDGFGVENDETAVVHLDPATGVYRHFISGRQGRIGHLDGVLSTDRELFVTDFTGPWSIHSSQARGAIYRVAPIGTPPGCGTGDGARPELTITVATQKTGTEVELRWPATWSACRLELGEALGNGAQWSRFSQEAELVGDFRVVRVPAGETARWYRLQCAECR